MVGDRWDNCVQKLEPSSPRYGYHIITFSSDGKYLAAATTAYGIDVWSVATGALHSTTVWDVEWRPNVAVKFLQNQTLATVSDVGTVRVFDQVSGVLCRTIEPLDEDYHSRLVPGNKGATILPNDDLVLLWPEGYIWVWSWDKDTWSNLSTSGKFINRLMGCLSDGTIVAGFSQEAAKDRALGVCLLDPLGSAPRILASGSHSHRSTVAVSSHDVIACAFRDEYATTIDLYKADTRHLRKLEHHCNLIHASLIYSPDGRYLIFGDSDSMLLHSWDLLSGTVNFIDTLPNQPTCMAFSSNGKSLAIASISGVDLQMFDLPSKKAFDSQKVEPVLYDKIVLSPNMQQVAARIASSNEIHVYSVETRSLEHTMPDDLEVSVIAFSPNGERIASASQDGTLRLWKLRQGTSETVMSGTPGINNVRRLTFSSNGDYLATGNGKGRVLLLDVESWTVCHVFELKSSVESIIFSSKDEKILCATNFMQGPRSTGEKDVGVWSVNTGQLLYEVESSSFGENTHGIYAKLSPNGRYLAYSCHLSLIVHDMVTEEYRSVLAIPQASLMLMAFSQDSKSLATYLSDDSIEIRNVEDLQLVGVSSIRAWIWRMSISQDGSFLDTNIGQIPIQRVQANALGDPFIALSRWRWDSHSSWIMEGERKMLWMPPSYRPNHGGIAHRDGTFVFASGPGKLVAMKFNQGEVVTDMQE